MSTIHLNLPIIGNWGRSSTPSPTPCSSRPTKPRSRSLDAEAIQESGVRLLQSRFNAMMARRKGKRRGSGTDTHSPTKSLSKKLASVLGDPHKKATTEPDCPESLTDSYTDGVRLQTHGISIPHRATPLFLSPSEQGSPYVLRRQRRATSPNPTPSYRTHGDDRCTYELPPGIVPRKRTISAGATEIRGSLVQNDGPPWGKAAGSNWPGPSGLYRTYGAYASDQSPRETSEDEDFEEEDLDGSEIDCAKRNIQKASIIIEESSDDSSSEGSSSDSRSDKGQLSRRHSMEPDRRRHGSGTIYVRGEHPDQAATTFRDCRGLPVAAVFLEKIRRSELEENESQIFVKFFKYHHTYDLIPTSAKLVIFDTRLQVKKAFYALVSNVVRAAPLWDAKRQQYVGMLTITDFIRILQSFYTRNLKMEDLEDHTLEKWRTLLHDDDRSLISISPKASLYDAIHALIHHKIHRLPVIDPLTGNVLYIITHKRILKFLYLYINELPKPSVMQEQLGKLNIGTYNNIETARQETLIIEALDKFVNRRISALPIVDSDGKLVDIYAKFDVINLAAKGTYNKLDVTLQEANEYRNEWFEGVRKCNFDETLGTIMERIVKAEVHRLVVVDKDDRVTGIISLSDILNELVLKPCNDELISAKTTTVDQIESKLSGTEEDPSVTSPGEDPAEISPGDDLKKAETSPGDEDRDPLDGQRDADGIASSTENLHDGREGTDALSQT